MRYPTWLFLADAQTMPFGAQAAWLFCAGKGGDRAAGGGHGAEQSGRLSPEQHTSIFPPLRNALAALKQPGGD
jgi:hypothetical protein